LVSSVDTARWCGASQTSIHISASGAPSSNSIRYRIVFPGAGSPVQLANHCAVRSDSVMLAHTSVIGAVNDRVSTRSRPLSVATTRPVGSGVMVLLSRA
jgi:hypothetical protein